MAADVVGLPPPQAGDDRTRHHDRALHRRVGAGLLRHQRSEPAECARGLSPAAEPAHDRHESGRKLEPRPLLPPVPARRDPQTLAAIFTEDPTRKIPIRLFGEGYQYNLFGLFPTRIHLIASAEPRQPLFLFGADRLGRCVYSRIMQGTQVSLSVGLVGVFLSLTLGVLIGGVSGYFGGKHRLRRAARHRVRTVACRRSRSGWRSPPPCRRTGRRC